MTILGQQSIAELIELLAAKDENIAQTSKAYSDFANAWNAKDAVKASEWASDWANLTNRYNQAKQKANIAIIAAKLTPVPNSGIPAQDSFDAVIKSLQLSPGIVSKGDLVELVGRLNDAGKTFAMPTVQPTATDFDLGVYKAADTAVKDIEKAEAKLGDATKSFLLSKPFLIGVAVIGVAGLGYLHITTAPFRRSR